MNIEPIAVIKNRYTGKFGIPRQSGKVKNLSEIFFMQPFRSFDSLRGIEGFSHLWLIFDFSLAHKSNISLTVRPPRLGGNRRMGVFATRSPYRPNSLGLSAVKLIEIKETADGPVLIVEGADLLNNTPIYDIKPYVPYSDSIEGATGGFTEENNNYHLFVETDIDTNGIEDDVLEEIKQILREDPRPQYKEDSEKIYKMQYAGYDVAFCVQNKTARIKEINEKDNKNKG